MLPELFRIPLLDLPVHTYGALLVSSILIAMLVAYRQALLGKKYHEDILDFGFWCLVGILVGARVLFIIVEADYYFVDDPFTEISQLGISIPTFLALWKGGFVFWGGVIGGLISMLIFCKSRGINPLAFADLCALGIPIGQSIGRIGCVAGGCCYGRADYHLDHAGHVISNTAFSISYPPGSIAYGSLFNEASPTTLELMKKLGTTVPLFPVQIIESLGNLVVYTLLLIFIPRKRAHGQIAVAYIMLYSILRIFTETMRGDSARGFIFNIMSTSQFISLVMATGALVFVILLGRRNRVIAAPGAVAN